MTGRCLRRVVPFGLLSAVLLAAMAMPGPILADEEENPLRDPSTYLPKNTVLFVQVAPWQDWARDWEKTGLAKIAQGY